MAWLHTERPITLEKGTSVLVPEPEEIVPSLERALAGRWPQREVIALWDGRAAERAVAALRRWLS